MTNTYDLSKVKIRDSFQRLLQVGTDGVVYDGSGSLAQNLILSGSQNVSGSFTSIQGFTGSLTKLITGTSFIEAGSNVTVVTGAQGQITISSTAAGAGGGPRFDDVASYVVIGNTSSLSNERALAAGTGIALTDGGANSTVTVTALDSILATLTGSVFSGTINVSGNVKSMTGFSGSLTKLYNGDSFLQAGSNITITTGTLGQVTIAGVAAAALPQFDDKASYIVIGVTSSLANERSIAAGTGIALTDGGANSTITVSGLDSIFATLTGSMFSGSIVNSGSVKAFTGFSGSLTRLYDGSQYLVAGSNMSITTGSTGQITIATSAPQAADNAASYIVIANTASLPNERALAAGTGISLTDAGANSSLTINVLDSIFATLTGSVFSGSVNNSGSFAAMTGFSGSLTKLYNGQSFLEAGYNTSITTGVLGQITIGNIAGIGADSAASYVVIGNTSSLPNERAIAAGTGISLTDGGANSTVTVSGLDSVFATLTGSMFSGSIVNSGSIKAFTGFSGSLTKLYDGSQYLIAGNNIAITTGSTGQITIASNEALPADIAASYVVIGNTSSLPNERALAAGTGIALTDGGANSTITVSGLDSIFATLTGSVFSGTINVSGNVKSMTGFSGSLTRLYNGDVFLNAGASIAIVTGSTGQVTITSFPGADDKVSYITIANTSSLPNERALAAGTGIALTDGGANSTITVSVLDSIFATLTGSMFSGSIVNSGSIKAFTGFSGSLTRLYDGTTYLAAGSATSITTGSNGQVTITSFPGADDKVGYITIANTASLSNERALAAGTGIALTDAGANSTLTVNVLDSIFATLTGSMFSGSVVVSGNVKSFTGFSGSLTKLYDGSQYLIAGTNISITTGSTGQITIASNEALPADIAASYVVIGNTASLPNERALTAGTGIALTDGGANSTVTVSGLDSIFATLTGSVFSGTINISGNVKSMTGFSGSLTKLYNGQSFLEQGVGISITTGTLGQVTVSGLDSIFATLTGSMFSGSIVNSGSIKAFTGFSGSLTRLYNGDAFLNAGASIAITTGSSGQVTIASFPGADDKVSYITIANTSSLSNERALAAGTGIALTDGGANSTVTVTALDSILATLTGSVFSGTINVSGNVKSMTGFSGSLTKLYNGQSFLEAGSNVTITTGTLGQITIAGVAASALPQFDDKATYIVISNTSSLGAERSLAAGTGIAFTDAGADSTFTISALDSILATLTGSVFSGSVVVSGNIKSFTGFSGSLTRLYDGQTYIQAGYNTSVITGATGQVTIGNVAGVGADSAASYVVIGNTASLPNERALAAGTGISLTDGGANSTVTVSGLDSIFATLTGSVFSGTINVSGNVKSMTGFSGSLTKLYAGTSFIEQGGGISISTGSTGFITISTKIKQTEIDFLNIPVTEKSFVITDTDVTANSNLMGNIAYVAPTGRDLDEVEMEPFHIAFAPGNGSFTLWMHAIEGPVTGKYKINYHVG